MSFLFWQRAYLLLGAFFLVLTTTSCNPIVKVPPLGTPDNESIASAPTPQPKSEVDIENTALPPSGLTVLMPSRATQIAPTVEPAVCSLNWCNSAGHFWLMRPIPVGGEQNIEHTYRFGTTQEGTRDVHHGVEFNNPRGTPVLAAADGIVVVAGNDKTEMYGDDWGFYGNLVIIEHQFPQLDEPIYTLYGHLDEILIETGNQIKVGDVVGKVGSTGYAIGSHLHFEVRQGGMQYKNSVNPELWLNLAEGMGAIAASGIADSYSENPYPSVKIKFLDEKQKPLVFYIETYADVNLQRDPEYNEFFAVGNLPEGKYEVTFSERGIPLSIEVEVKASQLTHIIYPSNTGE